MEIAQDNSQLQEKLYKEHGLNDLQVEIYMATLNTEIGLEISEIQKMFPKLQTNLDSLNQLLNTNLIELKSKGNQQYCKAVDLEEQSILSKLNSDQKRVYNVIKDSSTEGIWIRNIKQITGLTDHQIQQSLKHLERHYIIKSIKSVKNPAQKLYILSHLTPSSEITGGTFFTDQSFDDELVSNLMHICLNFIKDHSLSPDGKLYPIDYDLYPTLSEIHSHVRANPDSTSNKVISEDDTLQILKVMELEQMVISFDASVPVRRYNGTTSNTSTTRYKAVHIDESLTEERLTDIPCGVCPAMDSCSVDTILCSNIGDYYKDWIN